VLFLKIPCGYQYMGKGFPFQQVMRLGSGRRTIYSGKIWLYL
jgi:hypothetical protein